MSEKAVVGGWGSIREMVLEVVPPLKAVVKDSCVNTNSDEIGAVKPPKEHHAALCRSPVPVPVKMGGVLQFQIL